MEMDSLHVTVTIIVMKCENLAMEHVHMPPVLHIPHIDAVVMEE